MDIYEDLLERVEDSLWPSNVVITSLRITPGTTSPDANCVIDFTLRGVDISGQLGLTSSPSGEITWPIKPFDDTIFVTLPSGHKLTLSLMMPPSRYPCEQAWVISNHILNVVENLVCRAIMARCKDSDLQDDSFGTVSTVLGMIG